MRVKQSQGTLTYLLCKLTAANAVYVSFFRDNRIPHSQLTPLVSFHLGRINYIGYGWLDFTGLTYLSPK
jgi:hypothetical protein